MMEMEDVEVKQEPVSEPEEEEGDPCGGDDNDSDYVGPTSGGLGKNTKTWRSTPTSKNPNGRIRSILTKEERDEKKKKDRERKRLARKIQRKAKEMKKEKESGSDRDDDDNNNSDNVGRKTNNSKDGRKKKTLRRKWARQQKAKREQMAEDKREELRKKDRERRRLTRSLQKEEEQVKKEVIEEEDNDGDSNSHEDDSEDETEPRMQTRRKKTTKPSGSQQTDEEKKAKWREQTRLRRQRQREQMTPAQREEILRKDRERVRKKRLLLASTPAVKAEGVEISGAEALRAKWREEQRQRRQKQRESMTEEQIREANQRRQIRRLERKANMTDEERELEKTKNYLASLQRKAALSDEELERRRLRRLELATAYRNRKKKEVVPITDEIRAKRRADYIRWRDKMTPEQKARYLEKGRIKQRMILEKLRSDPDKWKETRKRWTEMDNMRRRAKKAAGTFVPRKKWKPKGDKKKTPRTRKTVTDGLSRRAVQVLRDRDRRAKETPEKRMKRLMYQRLSTRKRELRKKLTQEGMAPEQIQREVEYLEATFEPSNRWLKPHTRVSRRNQEVEKELEEFQQKTGAIPKYEAGGAISSIPIATSSKAPEPALSSTSSPSAAALCEIQFDNQQLQQPQISREYYYQQHQPNYPIPITFYATPAAAVEDYSSSSASAYHIASPESPPAPPSPVSHSDFEDYFTPPNAQPKIKNVESLSPRKPEKPPKKTRNYAGYIGPKGARPKTLAKSAEGVGLIICDFCGHSYPSRYMLEHKRKLHNPDYIPETGKCRLCDDAGPFPTHAQYYKKHWKGTHHTDTRQKYNREKTFICEECGAAFKTMVGCQFHKNHCHGEDQSVKCPYCDKILKNKISLNGHLNSFHRDKGKNPCLRCERKFKNQEEVKEHVKTDHPEFYFPCDGCGVLKYSMASKLFHYENCTKNRFITPEMRKERNESEKKAFNMIQMKCEICEHEMRLGSLTRHYRDVHGIIEEKFKCLNETCTKSFKSRDYWVGHMELFHMMDLEGIWEDVRKFNVGEKDRSKVGIRNMGGSTKTPLKKNKVHHKTRKRDSSGGVGKSKGRAKQRRQKSSDDEEIVEEEDEESDDDDEDDSQSDPELSRNVGKKTKAREAKKAQDKAEERTTPTRKSGRMRKPRTYDSYYCEKEDNNIGVNVNPHRDIEKYKRLVISIVPVPMPLTSSQIIAAALKKLGHGVGDCDGVVKSERDVVVEISSGDEST